MLNLADPTGFSAVAWQVFAILMAGVANWIITYILVAGAIFDGSRDLVRRKCSELATNCSSKTLRCLADNGKYFVTCQLCAGVWVGFALTPFVHGPFHSPIFGVTTVVNGLVIKGIGHATLELTSVWRTRSAYYEAQARLLKAQAKVLAPEHSNGQQRVPATAGHH